MNHGEKKRLAALAALQYIQPGTILGVGTGTTVNYFIDALPDVRNKIDTIVASSNATEDRLRGLNFEVAELSETGNIDVDPLLELVVTPRVQPEIPGIDREAHGDWKWPDPDSKNCCRMRPSPR